MLCSDQRYTDLPLGAQYLLRTIYIFFIQDGLFELRVGKKDITRTFFAFAKGKKIYILRTFVKKTPRTPPTEIQLALKRLEELTDES